MTARGEIALLLKGDTSRLWRLSRLYAELERSRQVRVAPLTTDPVEAFHRAIDRRRPVVLDLGGGKTVAVPPMPVRCPTCGVPIP